VKGKDILRLLFPDQLAVIEETLEKFKAAGKLKVGDEMDVPPVRTRVGKKLYELTEHKLRRVE